MAYLGDAVYELRIRQWLLETLFPDNALLSDDLHRRTTRLARCEFQARALESIMPHLDDAELAFARRARNLSIPVGRRSQQASYRQATAFEALIGHWSRTNPTRMEAIWERLKPLLAQEQQDPA